MLIQNSERLVSFALWSPGGASLYMSLHAVSLFSVCSPAYFCASFPQSWDLVFYIHQTIYFQFFVGAGEGPLGFVGLVAS